MQNRILICEDEKNIVAFLEAELLHVGYKTHVAYDGEKALEFFNANSYDLVLLDLMLPLKSGLEVLGTIRKTSSVPVIVLTARKDTFDKVLLLKTGADDYITKPFDTLELMARIERNIERDKNHTPNVRELCVEYENCVASINGDAVSLTKTEFEILHCLVKNLNRVMSREQIIISLYGDCSHDSNLIDVNVKNIRAKLLKHSEQPYILTVRGKGYVIRT